MTKVKCPRCDGQGSQVWDEDTRRCEDICYLCGGHGTVDAESAHMLLVQKCSEVLASRLIAKMRDECDNDPEGEGWAFAAAENMMTERDYTMAREQEMADSLMSELAGLSQMAQEAMIEALLLPGFAAPVAKADRHVSAPAASISEDDIPF